MPPEEAQKSPVASSFSEPQPQNPWAEELVERPDPSHLPSNLQAGTVKQQQSNTEETKTGISRVPQILMAGTARRQAAEELQRNHESKGFGSEPQWETSTQRLQSNNPFLRARNPSPNPWEENNRGHPSHLQTAPEQDWAHQDPFGERISQGSGFIPMAARLSLLDQPEDPWAQSSGHIPSQTSETSIQPQPVSDDPSRVWQSSSVDSIASKNAWQESSNQERTPVPSTRNKELDSWGSFTSNPYPPSQPQQQSILGSDLAHGSSDSASNLTPSSSQDLLDLNEAPWGNSQVLSQEQKAAEHHSGQNDRSVSDGPAIPSQGDALPSGLGQPLSSQTAPLSESEMKKYQEKQSETYAIRHINWTDLSGQLRESPILVQNKNGPCPLLALVNGLVMRAGNAQQPIVKALQTRERISLGLLIQALFDELTTYCSADEELPDIEALSRFLTMLHTGMNVNPRLTPESQNTIGSFLETNDLRLYGTFKVPLVHGWIAPPSSKAYSAMSRVAQYHEDIQLLQFRKEELEDHVLRGGTTLNADEEQLIRDIVTIDYFVNIENATQLSSHGLEQLAKALPPGSVSILFRNDHFSTLYKHPQSHQLFTLITDAGYADHAEIVWESLVDVNGSNAEFFAGDFRPVGHAPALTTPAGQRSSSNAARSDHHNSSTQQHSEQTDADFAYALSLQYQEEAQRENARSRRASTPQNTSRQSLAPRSATHNRSSSTTSGGSNSRYTPSLSDRRGSRQNQALQRPSIPTRNEQTTAPPARSPITPVSPHDGGHEDDADGDAPPPSYEQVARNKAYEAQRGRAISNRDISTYSSDVEYGRAPRLQQPFSGTGRRLPGIASTALPDRFKDKNKDCIVM